MLAGGAGFEVIGEAADGTEASDARRQRSDPDVVLMDLRMPRRWAARPLSASSASAATPARVLVLTTYDSDSDVVPALEAGATGYLLKDTPRAELVARHAAPRPAASRCSRRRSRRGSSASFVRPRPGCAQ